MGPLGLIWVRVLQRRCTLPKNFGLLGRKSWYRSRPGNHPTLLEQFLAIQFDFALVVQTQC